VAFGFCCKMCDLECTAPQTGRWVDRLQNSSNIQGVPKKRTFLNVDNFAMVSGRKACDMSKVCKFCLEKSTKLA